jgi:hypothetical protein
MKAKMSLETLLGEIERLGYDYVLELKQGNYFCGIFKGEDGRGYLAKGYGCGAEEAIRKAINDFGKLECPAS